MCLQGAWIWHRNNQVKDDKVIFRKQFELKEEVSSALMTIEVDTKYWLYVNGQEVVFEGGLFRESLPGCGYKDQIDITSYLKQGMNALTIFCWYYGNEGRNNLDSHYAGLRVCCEVLGMFSDESFKCLRHPAYYQTGAPYPAYLYGGYNIGFDANKDIGDYTTIEFDDSKWTQAQIYEGNVWGSSQVRPIPLIKTSEVHIEEVNQTNQQSYQLQLPYAMQYTPYIEVEAEGGEVISLCSDRYTVNGGPGDEYNKYNGHRIEYICKPGHNRFESLYYVFGEAIIITANHPIHIKKIGYRETGYDTALVGTFTCDCKIVNQLVEKAKRTLYVCMRDNFMDCPDRERGQWIGDVSVQVPQTIFVLDEKAQLLVKKAISDFINLRKDDGLVGNVPGSCAGELPSQSLNAISEWGMIATYYKQTRDQSVLALAFEPCIKYLQLWDLGEDGLIKPRQGDWRWFDHLYNIDEAVLENAWYYSALCFAETMAKILNNPMYDDFIKVRKESIECNFDRVFWNGRYYSSQWIVDDRANAMAVLSGLCKKENYEKVAKILLSVFNATIYMENYVLQALCEMGYIKEAYKRMVSRYYNLAVNENTTLWEDFYILGTKNHAWSGAPITIAFRYFLGITLEDGIKVKPVKGLFETMSAKVQMKDRMITIQVEDWGEKISIEKTARNKLDKRIE